MIHKNQSKIKINIKLFKWFSINKNKKKYYWNNYIMNKYYYWK